MEKGRRYYVDSVLAAYNGHRPGDPPEDFGEGEDELTAFGWSRNGDSEPINSGRNSAIQAMELGAPIENDVGYVLLDQHLGFDKRYGTGR